MEVQFRQISVQLSGQLFQMCLDQPLHLAFPLLRNLDHLCPDIFSQERDCIQVRHLPSDLLHPLGESVLSLVVYNSKKVEFCFKNSDHGIHHRSNIRIPLVPHGAPLE